MCWSGEASAVLATVGFAGTAYAAWKKQPFALWVSLGYFASMEALQALTYTVIDQCSLPLNQILTMLGYIHIMFQPFFVNAVSLHFMPREVAQRLEKPAYFLCFLSVIFMIFQLYPFDWAGTCNPSRMLCGPHLCSVHGNWHIGWQVPVNGIGNWFTEHQAHPFFSGFITYIFVVFVMPFIYGSWRFTIYHFLLGPALAKLLTNNVNEVPAVWCLLSIGLLLIVAESPVRRIMYAKDWPLWRLFGWKPKKSG